MTHLRCSRGVRALAAAVVATLALTATATAEKVKLTAADKALARAATLTMADVGSGWTQRAKKPDFDDDGTSCPGYKPKTSDLVVTGAAATKFEQVGAAVESEVEIMRTAKMVQHDWQRTVSSPRLLPCLRSILRKQSAAKSRFISIKPLKLPSITTYTAGYRMVIDVRAKSGKIRMAVDILLVGRGRTEVTLTTTMPLESAPTLFPNELVWVRTLAGRIGA